MRASHELRTPVTGMHMAFGLFRERAKFPAESREADLLDTVNEEMQRLMQLINDLLNFSRYQNGMQNSPWARAMSPTCWSMRVRASPSRRMRNTSSCW